MRPFTPHTLHTLHNSPKGISTARSHLHIFPRISTAKISTCEYPITALLPEYMLIKPPANIPIENTNINTHPGVEPSPAQKTLVGSVLDLFAGRPSLEKLTLRADNGVFEDPLNHRQR